MDRSSISKLFRVSISGNKKESAADVIMRGRLYAEDDLVLNYLFNFQNEDPIRRLSGFEYMELYNASSEMTDHCTVHNDKKYALGEIDERLYAIDKLLNHRRTSREFNGIIDKESFLQLLSVSLRDRLVGENLIRRAYPSGGALYPIRLLFNVLGLSDIEDGVYSYDHRSNSLHYFDSAMSAEYVQEKILKGQDITLGETKILVIYLYDLMENYIKYYDISLSLAFIEVGAISQTLQIVAPSCGIGYCDIGGFPKGKMEKSLKLNEKYYHIVHVGIMGGI